MSRTLTLSFMGYKFGFRLLFSGFEDVGVKVAATKKSRTCSSINPMLITRIHGFGDGML